MIDYKNIGKYTENNRIEAKRATGGLPESIWETYSAFANTLGGVILLGVVERSDKTLDVVGVPDPEWLVGEFLSLLNDTRVVNKNILDKNDVTILDPEGNGKSIVAIRVPRAGRRTRPIYIGDSAKNGSFRRNGEGDYKCSAAELDEIYRAREESLAEPPSREEEIVAFLTERVSADLRTMAAALGGEEEELLPVIEKLVEKSYVIPVEADDARKPSYRLRIKPISKKNQ